MPSQTYQIQQQTIELALDERVFAPSAHGLYYANNIRVAAGEQVIDIGCGSGILAVYAARQGASVLATDISAAATELTAANALRNGVEVDTATGGFFAGSDATFDVILANLPQEIVMPDSARTLGERISEIDGGLRGNDLLLQLLEQAPAHMHKQSRLYLPLHTLSDYHHSLKSALQNFNVTLIAIGDLPAKSFVTDQLGFYLELAEAGVIRLFKHNEQWYTNIYVIELTLKSTE
ncbi:50S ribosomal protein L11 methyltransferase [Pseudidiomarina sp.]|uniref:50S ribosomal protein L11 methyltransferase n=1 Tax=Pseudidiomarina sp. TaxID=2081707 RepID=UPI00299DED83|nr:50S ribosomal protein L11 methyltransferase [Pseudidiomarina sp.]MDX1706537.1 50S ribosomal protein L11 methyltransferase [Pseudidiomarina sp.]